MRMSEEDYLKYIYKQGEKKPGEFISIKDMSVFFGYRVQSVIEMIKKMQRKNTVIYQPYKGVKLTKTGVLKAELLVSSHRIWEYFLMNELKLEPELVHENAEILEHATSKEVLIQLYDYIGKPKHCPHGQVIPEIKE